ncbi:hypothetical protein [Arthrobacter sp. NIO-1057]|uniref:hypothetical protein n=1 Tax=Arthrobacter sp. NIO-1057 TaxID=993071 RepID=UPI00071DC877|nr:hypothetical protein [Arthrobacter sp. NIO-1057]KSU66549.1 hypothetical protein AS038_07700 [Arthrobacter sp. NIO-1057]SCC17368.1 hypothetical protein GA0061084_1561 [Arthrobacter sp. NIO-1057]
MMVTSSATESSPVQRLALGVSHVLSPIIVATLLLALSPLRDASISWAEAVVAALFTTIIPWILLAVAKLRGKVSDLHVTVRHQRNRIYAMTAALILGGLFVLWLMDASAGIFREVYCILLGLLVVAVINFRWKVSVHMAVGTYVILQVAGQNAALMPWVVLFIAVLSWSRIRSFQHTATQVCGGVMVGIAIHYAHEAMALVLN